MHGFEAREVLEGVFHIRDAMGVYMTLLTGRDRALLVDAGYGLEDVASYIRTLTDLPVELLLTHAHHDHALGAIWFDRASLFEPDFPALEVYTGKSQRMRVAGQAREKGIAVAQDYLTRPMPPAQAARAQRIELGGMSAQIRLCPGHTPGSAVVYIPERRLLLTGDDWNPCTWLFFPEALGAHAYRANVRALLEWPFEHVLCSHRGELYPRAAFESFLGGLTDDALRAARKVDMGRDTDTREACPAVGQQFVFDYDKAVLGGGEDYK